MTASCFPCRSLITLTSQPAPFAPCLPSTCRLAPGPKKQRRPDFELLPHGCEELGDESAALPGGCSCLAGWQGGPLDGWPAGWTRWLQAGSLLARCPRASRLNAVSDSLRQTSCPSQILGMFDRVYRFSSFAHAPRDHKPFSPEGFDDAKADSLQIRCMKTVPALLRLLGGPAEAEGGV